MSFSLLRHIKLDMFPSGFDAGITSLNVPALSTIPIT
jgi:hypothetical protein